MDSALGTARAQLVHRAARWAAAVCALAACAAAGLAAAAPTAAGLAGFALLAGLAGAGALALFSLWPRTVRPRPEARAVAEAAASAGVAWAIVDAEGAIADCNETYRRMAGATAGEAAPPPELALRSEGSAAMLYRLARSAAVGQAREESIPLDTGGGAAVSVRRLNGGGAVWWFRPVPPAAWDGDRENHAAPAGSFATLWSDAPIGAAILGPDGRIAESNSAFAAFFGAGRTVSGRAFADLVNAADRHALAGLISGTGGSAPLEIRPAGKLDRMAELYAGAARAGERVTVYLIDVSEQKALETKFAQSQKMQAVGQLAGGVAHDFNNLLTVIMGNCEFLLMRHRAGDPSFREINDIHQNAIRAANLVKQLLAFSRQQTMQPRVLDLGAAIGELGDMLRRLLGEGVALKLDRVPELWPVRADEAQIANAIVNLAVNAQDAMPGGGALTIRMSNETLDGSAAAAIANMPPGDYVRLDVSDTGVGIPAEYIGKIFDPFFTTKPKGEGTGLGLASVYGIVKQMSGFVAVNSEAGRGATFSVYLPRHLGEIEVCPETAAARDITGEETILLVEDEEAVRSFAARALRQRGYRVLEAAGGEQALDIVKKQPGDIRLLITDVVMPNMDGPTLVRAARRIQPEMQAIFISGYAEESFRRNEEKAEDLHFLPKPFGLKQLAAKVKDVLSVTAPAQ